MTGIRVPADNDFGDGERCGWGGGSKLENEVQILMVRVRNDCCSWSEILLKFFPFTRKVYQ